jgi:hypothetical protein
MGTGRPSNLSKAQADYEEELPHFEAAALAMVEAHERLSEACERPEGFVHEGEHAARLSAEEQTARRAVYAADEHFEDALARWALRYRRLRAEQAKAFPKGGAA